MLKCLCGCFFLLELRSLIEITIFLKQGYAGEALSKSIFIGKGEGSPENGIICGPDIIVRHKG